MSLYLIRVGEALAEVLERTRTTQPEQFAGYWANFDFWLGEFSHLASIRNGYERRFQIMTEGMQGYVDRHGRRHNIDGAGVPFQGVVRTTSQTDRNQVVTRCKDAMERMVERAVNLGLIDFNQHDDLLLRVRDAEKKGK